MKKTATNPKNIEKKPKRTLTNKDIIALAKRIKELRIKQGFTNYEYFAYEKNIARSQFGRYEKGEDIRFSSLIKLIRAFDMTPSEFFEGFK